MIWVSCTAASGMSLYFYANTTSWCAFNYSTLSGSQACGWDQKGNPSRTQRGGGNELQNCSNREGGTSHIN